MLLDLLAKAAAQKPQALALPGGMMAVPLLDDGRPGQDNCG
jgi:hypothetical protein